MLLFQFLWSRYFLWPGSHVFCCFAYFIQSNSLLFAPSSLRIDNGHYKPLILETIVLWHLLPPDSIFPDFAELYPGYACSRGNPLCRLFSSFDQDIFPDLSFAVYIRYSRISLRFIRATLADKIDNVRLLNRFPLDHLSLPSSVWTSMIPSRENGTK